MFGFINHKITDLNKFAKCEICNGYLIDATTVIECMHSFCKTCIMRHLEDCNTCPSCGCQLHETKPYLDVRTDKVLQAIVYKLFPGVHREEMRRRRQFYLTVIDRNEESHVTNHKQHELAQLSPEKRGDIIQDSCGSLEEDLISVALTMRCSVSSKIDNDEAKPIYLLCPSILTVGHLVKFLSQKLALHSSSSVTVFCEPQEELDLKYSLLDILCSYLYNRQYPLSLHYCITSPLIAASSNPNLLNLTNNNNDNLFFLPQDRSSRNKDHFLRNRIKPSLKAELASKSMTSI